VPRDVKPSNVLIGQAAGKEHCYLGDFGLTKRAGSLSGVSVTGTIVGTLEYVAPEQITGDPLDARADVYSLGCVLYECLTGQSPFPRATDVALLWAHVHEQPEPLSTARPELPSALDPVLARALAKEPARRQRSASELVAEARSALGLVEATPARARTSRRLLLAGAALLVLLAAAALAAFLLTRGSGALDEVSPNSVGMIDPTSNEIVSEAQVGIDPEAVAVGAGGVWVANVEDETVSRIDPVDTQATPHTISVDGYPSDVTVGDRSVWVALGAIAELTRINPDRTDATTPTPALGEGVMCGAPQASVTFGGGYLWFVCKSADLGRVDPATGRGTSVALEAGLLTSSSPVLPEFADVVFGLGSLWIVNRPANAIVEVDSATSQKLREITVGQGPTAIAAGPDALWVANFDEDTVTRVTINGPGRPPTLTIIPVGDGPVDVAVGDGGVWVANRLDRTLSRIDPEGDEVVATIAIGNEPQRVAAGEGAVWVTVRAPSAEVSGS
jgi:DNA-binding beta-propeller fold protein YncE